MRDLQLERSVGRARISFKMYASRTALGELYQQGCCKVRFPRQRDASLEAVLLNTSGGLTDGDDLAVDVHWNADTCGIVTTQAAERLYRARADAALVRTQLTAGEGATACWLPQETIVFDGGRIDRRTDVELAASSTLLALESLVFGREAMGESVRRGLIDDAWRVRVDGRLVFTDRLRIAGDDGVDIDAQLQRGAIANGARAVATLVYASPDCTTQFEGLRGAITDTGVPGGVSNLGPLLVVRLLAPSGFTLRNAVMHIIGRLAPTLDISLPRVWQY